MLTKPLKLSSKYLLGLLIALGSVSCTTTVPPSYTESTGVSEGFVGMDATEMLYAHNIVRADVGLPALRWSNKLAQYAQDWADHLANQEGCRMIHRFEQRQNQANYGENLFWASSMNWNDGRVSEPQSISSSYVAYDWASEKQFYSYNANHCRPSEECGHYTQMVWRNTTDVGCAVSLCPENGQIWVCNYNPPGNWQGERPY